jgi:hypothetical protein
MMQRFGFLALVAALALAGTKTAQATSYASNVVKTGTTVTFTLNEPADSLKYSINGGALQALDGTSKGTKTFNLGAASDTFSIVAEKNSATGFTIPTGNVIPLFGTGLTVDTNEAGFNLISDDASNFARYNSPRGVDVSKNPNAATFGTVYIANSAEGPVAVPAAPIGPGTTPLPAARALAGEGLYALRADMTDAFGFGDTAQNPNTTNDGFPAFSTNSSNSPYRLTVAANGEIYVSDYSDVNGNVFKMDSGLTTATYLLGGIGGPIPPGCPCGTGGTPTSPDATGIPAGQNHGSISATYITGSTATGDLTMWAIDEDINSAHVLNDTNAAKNDRNSLWKWTIGGPVGTTGFTGMPTKVSNGTGGTLIGDFPDGGIVVDLAHGPDGKFYMAQYRSAGLQPGILVIDPTTGNTLFNSLDATRTLLANPAAPDIFANVGGIDVSPDGKWLATIEIDNDLAIIPLVDGIPDIANRMLMDNGSNTGNGRDIAFDAAGNLHVVSSGQGMYRVLSPGGNRKTTLSWDGTAYSFTNDPVAPAGTVGDYNNNGVVDAADYVVWRNAGATYTLPNDSTPGTVNTADYDAWRANFGNPPGSGSSSAVPEPATVALLALGLIGACGTRRRSA